MRKSFFIFLLAIPTSTLFAQETVYFEKNTKSTKSGKKDQSAAEQIVKISPLSFIAGFIPVYYERSINETFSVQVGAGITSTNYIKDVLRYAKDDENGDISSTKYNGGSAGTSYTNLNNTETYRNRKTGLGYYVSLEPRVYFSSEGLEGSFMGLSLSNARYNISSKKVTTGPTLSGEPTFTNNTYNGNETITDLFVNFGSQTLYDKIAIEYHFGLGLRKISGKEYAFAQDFSGAGQRFIDGESTLNKTKVGFNLSIKVGYQF